MVNDFVSVAVSVEYANAGSRKLVDRFLARRQKIVERVEREINENNDRMPGVCAHARTHHNKQTNDETKRINRFD